MVLILQWLERRCAEFTIYPSRRKSSSRKSHTPRVKDVPVPPLFARFDTIALHTALDRVRQRAGSAGIRSHVTSVSAPVS